MDQKYRTWLKGRPKSLEGTKFEDHLKVFLDVFADYKTSPPTVWSPPGKFGELAIRSLMKETGQVTPKEFHSWSAENRIPFWNLILDHYGLHEYAVSADARLEKGFEFLAEKKINISEICFQADANQIAIQEFDQSLSKKEVTYAELEALTGQVANSLLQLGIKPGDRVVLIAPMTIRSVATYLGILRAGGAAVLMPDSIGNVELKRRLNVVSPELLMVQSAEPGGKGELYERVKSVLEVPIIFDDAKKPRKEDRGWDSFLQKDSSSVIVKSFPQSNCTVLFSSGTTGDAKMIPWSQATPIKMASDALLYHAISPTDIVSWTSGMGWMMGPWLIFATLANRATLAITTIPAYTAGYGQFVEAAQLTMLGVVPSIVRLWRKHRLMWNNDWSSITRFSSTGEVSNPIDSLYLMALANYSPVIEYCGGTEIGGAYVSSTLAEGIKLGAFNTKAFGLDFEIPRSGEGVHISPPAMGLHYSGTQPIDHGDHVVFERGCYQVLGRSDDAMNLSGIKISSSEIENACLECAEVSEVAAISSDFNLRGPEELILYVVAAGSEKMDLLLRLQDQIKHHCGSNFRVHDIVLVDSLPKTLSGKIQRKLLRERYAQSHFDTHF